MATDLESGRHQKNPKLNRSLGMKIVSIQAFLGLLLRIRSRPPRLFRRDETEADVYNRLMDDLEEEEEESSSRWWRAKALVVGEVVLLLGLVAALVATAAVKGEKLQRWPKSQGPWLWQWVALVMVLFSGLSVVRFVTFVVFTPVKWRWRVHRYVVYMLEGIKWCVDVTLWFGLVLVAWYLWFKPKLRQVQGDVSKVATYQTTRLLITLVLGSFLWTLKNVLYLKLKADLHYDQLYDRIQQTVIDFHGIQIIYHEGVWKFLTSPKNMLKGTAVEVPDQPQEHDQKKEEDKMGTTKGLNIWIDVHRLNKKTDPIWVIRQLAIVYLKQMKKGGLPRNRR